MGTKRRWQNVEERQTVILSWRLGFIDGITITKKQDYE